MLRTQRYAYPADKKMPQAEWSYSTSPRARWFARRPSRYSVPQASPIMAQWAWWAQDGSAVYYLSQPRDLRTLTLHRLDPATGGVTTVLSETGTTRVEPSQWMTERPIVRVLSTRCCGTRSGTAGPPVSV